MNKKTCLGIILICTNYKHSLSIIVISKSFKKIIRKTYLLNMHCILSPLLLLPLLHEGGGVDGSSG